MVVERSFSLSNCPKPGAVALEEEKEEEEEASLSLWLRVSLSTNRVSASLLSLL